MRRFSTFVIVVSLILGATAIGVWAASTAHHAKGGAKGALVEHSREAGLPARGLFVAPPAYR
jgi:hypothetical protein